MVKLAKNWKTVPEQRKCSIKAPNPVNLMIPGRNAGTAAIEVNKECAVAFLEHVQVGHNSPIYDECQQIFWPCNEIRLVKKIPTIIPI